MGDLSLRALAAALGTSHRMLIHHFGSKERPLGRDRPRGRAAPARPARRHASRPGAARRRGDAGVVEAHLRPGAVAQRAAVLRALRTGAPGPPAHGRVLDGIVDELARPDHRDQRRGRRAARRSRARTRGSASPSPAGCCSTCSPRATSTASTPRWRRSSTSTRSGSSGPRPVNPLRARARSRPPAGGAAARARAGRRACTRPGTLSPSRYAGGEAGHGRQAVRRCCRR